MTGSLPELYEVRFDEREVSQKDAVWREIVAYLGRFIDPDAPVLDIACDRGHFIRFVNAPRAVGDRHPRRLAPSLPPEVHFVQAPGMRARQGAADRPFRHRLHEQLPRAPRVRRGRHRAAAGRRGPAQRRAAASSSSSRTSASSVPATGTSSTTGSPSPSAACSRPPRSPGSARSSWSRGSCPTRPRGDCRATRAWSALYLSVPLMWRLMGRQTLYVGERRA